MITSAMVVNPLTVHALLQCDDNVADVDTDPGKPCTHVGEQRGLSINVYVRWRPCRGLSSGFPARGCGEGFRINLNVCSARASERNSSNISEACTRLGSPFRSADPPHRILSSPPAPGPPARRQRRATLRARRPRQAAVLQVTVTSSPTALALTNCLLPPSHSTRALPSLLLRFLSGCPAPQTAPPCVQNGPLRAPRARPP